MDVKALEKQLNEEGFSHAYVGKTARTPSILNTRTPPRPLTSSSKAK
jgi:hypothetical protein